MQTSFFNNNRVAHYSEIGCLSLCALLLYKTYNVLMSNKIDKKSLDECLELLREVDNRDVPLYIKILQKKEMPDDERKGIMNDSVAKF